MATPQQAQPDLTLPTRVMVPIVLAILVVMVTYKGFSSGNLLYFLGLVLAPVAIYLIQHPSTFLISIIALFQSTLTLPGIPQGLMAYHVAAFGFTLLTIATIIINKNKNLPTLISNRFLILFFAVLALTIGVRGIGLRAFGGENWGGMGYIQLFMIGTFLLCSRYHLLTIRQWKTTVLLMLAMCSLPTLAQLIYLASGGAIYRHFSFIKANVPQLVTSLSIMDTGRGVLRFANVADLAIAFFSVVMIFLPLGRRYNLARVIGIVIAMALIGMSGFRSVLINILITIVIYVIIVKKHGRFQRLAATAMLGVVCWVGLVASARSLPLPVQRSISWIPGVTVSTVAQMDADATVNWRFELWKMAWNDVPNYLWIGKGFAINLRDFPTLSQYFGYDSVLVTFLTHNYHSGPLTVLLDLGVFGAIAVVGFLFFASIEVYRGLGLVRDVDPFLYRAYVFFCAFFYAKIVSFFVIFGDVRTSLVDFFVYLVILQGIQLTSAARQKEKIRNAVPERKPGLLPREIRSPLRRFEPA